MVAAADRWVVILALWLSALAVTPAPGPVDTGGGPIEPPRSEIPEEQERATRLELERNLRQLEAEGPLPQATAAVSFIWPLRPADSLADYGYHGVSGFVDHDPAIGSLRDYMCGQRTYDLSSGYNHGGTDFFTYPFGWLKMDRDEVEVVAAADGVIIYRHDGELDRNCSMSDAKANAIILRHADGTRTRYLHMKKDSVTPKGVGQTVEAGEYLGIVGSSGSSTGPHLHFEVENAAYQDIDPYIGPCNTSASLWATQPPYYDSAINAVHTASAPMVRPPCPQPEVPNTKTHFEPGDTVYFVTYYRDQLKGQQSVYRVYRPDGTVWQQWTGALTVDHYAASYWYRAYTLGSTAPAGTWRFEVTYEGKIYGTSFIVGDPSFVTVTYPSGGEVLQPGILSWVIWEDNLDGDVRTDLHADGELLRTLKASTPSDGFDFWAVPVGLDPAVEYTIRVSSVDTPWVSGDSAPFVISGPIVDFSAASSLGLPPLTVTFTDQTRGLVDRWAWDFGDGVTSTLQYPVHVYDQLGAYTVTLTAGNALEQNQRVKPALVRVVDTVWRAYLPLVLRPQP